MTRGMTALMFIGLLVAAQAAPQGKVFPSKKTAARVLGLKTDASREEVMTVFKNAQKGKISPSIMSMLPAERRSLEQVTCDTQESFMQEQMSKSVCSAVAALGEDGDIMCSLEATDDNCDCFSNVMLPTMDLDCSDGNGDDAADDEGGVGCGADKLWPLQCGGDAGLSINLMMCLAGAMTIGFGYAFGMLAEPTCSGVFDDNGCAASTESMSTDECTCLEKMSEMDGMLDMLSIAHVACHNLENADPSVLAALGAMDMGDDDDDDSENDGCGDFVAYSEGCGLLDAFDLASGDGKVGGSTDSGAASLAVTLATLLAIALL